jgi:hypothetical protein
MSTVFLQSMEIMLKSIYERDYLRKKQSVEFGWVLLDVLCDTCTNVAFG